MPRRKPKRTQSRQPNPFKREPKQQKNHDKPRIFIKGATDNQDKYIKSIEDKSIIFCTGPAGSGKSFIAAGLSAQYLLDGEYEQLIVSRPLVCTGKEVGSLPGELADKIKPYFGPIQDSLKKFLGPYYGLCVNDHRIRFEPLEFMKGYTFNNTIMVLDEAQNCTTEQIKMFVTRIGSNSKVIINGDVRQTDIPKRSGLEYIIEKIKNISEISVIRLTYDDIQRHDLVSKFLRAVDE
jgi:phosphate starvation-inducible PhoH-like protein